MNDFSRSVAAPSRMVRLLRRLRVIASVDDIGGQEVIGLTSGEGAIPDYGYLKPVKKLLDDLGFEKVRDDDWGFRF